MRTQCHRSKLVGLPIDPATSIMEHVCLIVERHKRMPGKDAVTAVLYYISRLLMLKLFSLLLSGG